MQYKLMVKTKNKNIPQGMDKVNIMYPHLIKGAGIILFLFFGYFSTAGTPLDKSRLLIDIKSKTAIDVVNGVVVDEEQTTLIGVNVRVKGTNKGTATDFDGRFELEDVADDATLIFSYIGYQTQEILLNGRSELTITMISDAAVLDEVVVVG